MGPNKVQMIDSLFNGLDRSTFRFPAHEYTSGASKILTIIYYDRTGKVMAVGAEAVKEGIYETATDEHWVKAEWCVLIFFLGRPFKHHAGSNCTSDLEQWVLEDR